MDVLPVTIHNYSWIESNGICSNAIAMMTFDLAISKNEAGGRTRRMSNGTKPFHRGNSMTITPVYLLPTSNEIGT